MSGSIDFVAARKLFEVTSEEEQQFPNDLRVLVLQCFNLKELCHMLTLNRHFHHWMLQRPLAWTKLSPCRKNFNFFLNHVPAYLHAPPISFQFCPSFQLDASVDELLKVHEADSLAASVLAIIGPRLLSLHIWPGKSVRLPNGQYQPQVLPRAAWLALGFHPCTQRLHTLKSSGHLPQLSAAELQAAQTHHMQQPFPSLQHLIIHAPCSFDLFATATTLFWEGSLERLAAELARGPPMPLQSLEMDIHYTWLSAHFLQLCQTQAMHSVQRLNMQLTSTSPLELNAQQTAAAWAAVPQLRDLHIAKPSAAAMSHFADLFVGLEAVAELRSFTVFINVYQSIEYRALFPFFHSLLPRMPANMSLLLQCHLSTLHTMTTEKRDEWIHQSLGWPNVYVPVMRSEEQLAAINAVEGRLAIEFVGQDNYNKHAWF